MNRDPVFLRPDQRARAVQEFASSFEKWKVPFRIIAIDRMHIHALVQCADRNPRHWVGLAKKESSAYMKRDGLAPDGGLWAVRCKCLPISGAAHFDRVTGYIRDHQLQGAVVVECEAIIKAR